MRVQLVDELEPVLLDGFGLFEEVIVKSVYDLLHVHEHFLDIPLGLLPSVLLVQQEGTDFDYFSGIEGDELDFVGNVFNSLLNRFFPVLELDYLLVDKVALAGALLHEIV